MTVLNPSNEDTLNTNIDQITFYYTQSNLFLNWLEAYIYEVKIWYKLHSHKSQQARIGKWNYISQF